MSEKNTPESPKQTSSEADAQTESAMAQAVPGQEALVDEGPAAWPLEADRLAQKSPLLECLQLLAGQFGRRVSVNALSSGLPIPTSGITPSLFIRAAERADLSARLVQKSLGALAIAPNFPCIAVLDGQQACIIQDMVVPKGAKIPKGKLHAGTKFKIIMPETPDAVEEIGIRELTKIFSGHLFFIRPIARNDDRAGPAEIEEGRSWFKSAMMKNKGIYVEVAMAAIVINIFAIASPLFTMNVYDRVVPNNAIPTLWVLAAGVFLAFLFDYFLKNLRAMFLDVAGRRADVKISSNIFEQVMGMKLIERPSSAGVLTANMREFETIRDFFTSATMVTLIDMPFAILFLVVIYLIAGPVAIVPLVAMPLILAVGFLMQRKLMATIKESMAESAMKSALLFETVTGMETVKVQAAESHVQRRWEELSEKSSLTSVKMRKIASLTTNWAMFIQQCAGVSMVIVGAYLIADGQITMGALIASVMLSSRALSPLSQAAALMTRYNQSKQSFKQLDDLMSKEVERPKGKHFISLTDVKGQVDFRDVTFHYPDQQVAALNRATFSIKPGEHVGVIGAVGSGKTTMQRLLMNLYEPSSGTVMLDGTDVRQIDPGDLRRNIGVVQQRPQLFYGSVRENITMGHETAPDRAVLRAAELSGVTDFLRDTQHGLDTQVGERGEALSGGQQQAIAVARALLYDPPVIILDEPTASMDPASENRLMKRLEALTEGRTVILITHKGAMLSLVDKIVLMDRGYVLAYGEKDDVIGKLRSGYFNKNPNTETTQEKMQKEQQNKGDA